MVSINLSFFTEDDKITKLCQMYWQMTDEHEFVYKVSEIAKEFQIQQSKLTRFVADHCDAKDADFTCANCGKAYIYSSRSDFQQHQSGYKRQWLCDECTLDERNKALAAKQALEAEKRKIIQSEFSLENRLALNVEDLSLEEAVYLLSIVRLGAIEDFTYVHPLDTLEQSLAPGPQLKYDIVKELYHNHVLYVHPRSDVTSFEFEGNSIKSFYLGKVYWALPIHETTLRPHEIIEDLEKKFQNMDWAESWYDETRELWNRIALAECLEYLDLCLKEHGFTFNPGDKTILVFNQLLEDYSVAQIYSFIWRSAKDAASFYLRNNVTKQHAANSAIGSVQRMGEQAKVAGWEVKPYRRDFRCPQSMISQVFFNTVLHIGDEGFTKPPRD